MTIPRLTASYLAGLLLLALPAVADWQRFADKPCSELRKEVEHYLARFENDSRAAYNPDSPMMAPINSALEGLETEDARRIGVPLSKEFPTACFHTDFFVSHVHKNSGLVESPTVGQAIDAVLDFYDLDRSKPRWGLKQIPEIDLSSITLDEFGILISEHPDFRPNLNPINDIFTQAFAEYWSAYDLTTPDAWEKAGRVMTYLTFEAGRSGSVRDVLDLLAAEEGLERK